VLERLALPVLVSRQIEDITRGDVIGLLDRIAGECGK
jgi:hypothetical protein